LLVGAVIGGIATLPGALIGGAFVQFVEKYADAATRSINNSENVQWFLHNVGIRHLELEPWTIYGIALIALMFLMPNGIAGALAILARRLGIGGKRPG
jgi:branched-chain amino acid transport system permease protein